MSHQNGTGGPLTPEYISEHVTPAARAYEAPRRLNPPLPPEAYLPCLVAACQHLGRDHAQGRCDFCACPIFAPRMPDPLPPDVTEDEQARKSVQLPRLPQSIDDAWGWMLRDVTRRPAQALPGEGRG